MSALAPHATDPGASRAAPDLLATWPRSSQYALSFLVFVTLGLIAAHVLVGRLSDARPTTLATQKTLTRAIDLNKADFAQLRQVPELGDKLATAILDYRNSRGGFVAVEELINVPGIGRMRLERFKQWLFVEDDEPARVEGTSKPVPVSLKKPAVGGVRKAKGAAPKEPLDLNTASEEQLRQLDGLGGVLARRIVEAREKQPFRTVEDLLKIPYLKHKTLEKVRPHVTVTPSFSQDE